MRSKRILDIILSVTALILLCPVMAGIGAMVALRLGRPVLFVQARPGIGGRAIRVRKFRTMTDEKDENGDFLPDDVRLTEFGKWLRSTSLDELPELWNVLVGDMSMVGPRPLLEEYLALYDERQARRHAVPPGITGWAQVNGRNATTWEERLEMDVWYVENRSIWLDLRILLMTIFTVFSREGVSAAGHATMPRFTGSAGRREGQSCPKVGESQD